MKLKIGQLIFQYSGMVLEYEIIEIQKLETNKHIETFYIAKCLSCRDHDPCIVAFKKDDDGKLTYSHMINQYDDDDDDECYNNRQYFWHKNIESNFFLSKREAQLFALKKNIDYYTKEIKRLDDFKEKLLSRIEKQKIQIDILNEEWEEVEKALVVFIAENNGAFWD